MTTDVQALAPNEIDRSGVGISANNQPQGFRESNAQPAAPMGEAQSAAIAKINELRSQASDPALSRDQRDAIVQKMAQLSKHAFLGDRKPAWYGEATPDPRDISTEAHDGLADSLRGASDTLTDGQHAQLIVDGKVFGMDPSKATQAADFCKASGLDPTTAKIVVKRFSQHIQNGWGPGALTEEQTAELAAENVRRFGSAEKAIAESEMAQAYLESVGLGDWAEKQAGSLAFDPVVISMLALKGRQRGIKVPA